MAPPIHAVNGKKVDVLEKQLKDFNSLNKPQAPHGVSGTGTHHDPYCYKAPASESVHFGVVDLWYAFKDKAGGPYFIKVGSWLFKVGPTGVTAEDGRQTRLLPSP
jgi:hypothetical protein